MPERDDEDAEAPLELPEDLEVLSPQASPASAADPADDMPETTEDLPDPPAPEHPREPSAAAGKANAPLSVEAAELTACDPDTSAILCETVLFEPDPSEERLGSLYAVMETINLSPDDARGVLESVVSALRTEYYRDPARDMLESLESALAEANHVLAELAERGAPDWGENFHAAAAVFRGRTLHISRSGKGELLLLRKDRLTDVGEGLSDPHTRHPLHPFASVATGMVAEHDALILSTPQLLYLIPQDRLPQFLSGKNPARAVSSLRSLLEDAVEHTAFAALVLRFSRIPERLPAPEVPKVMPRHAQPYTPRPRVDRPGIRPRVPITTKSTLAQQAGRIARRLGVLLATAARERVFPVLRAAARWSARRGNLVARRTGRRVRGAVATWQSQRTPSPAIGPSGMAGSLGTQLSAPAALLTRAGARAALLTTLPRDGVALLRRRFQHLPKSARTFLVLTVIFGVLFAGSLLALSRKRQEDAAIRAALERLQEARVKKEGADAALIYDNTDQARQLLRGSRVAAEEVAKTPYYTEDVTALLAGLQETEDRTERVTRVREPAVVGDFANVAPSLETPAMVAIGTALYAFNPENNAIYRLNTETGEAKVVSQTSQGIGYFRAAHALPAEKTILFSTDSPGLSLFDTERGDLLKQEIELPEGVATIRAIGTFGSRLYVLSPDTKMVYSYAKTLSGYAGGTPWLKEGSVPADRAVAMGIDGYIYLLTDNGEIVKLLKGAPVEFKQTALSTPAERPTRLLITENLKHLYVLDPAHKRVLVYDTLGTLTRQFVFDSATELRDIAVLGKEETLFVLDQTRVYRVGL